MCYPAIVIEIREYINAERVSLFGVWRASLDPVTRARVTASVYRMEAGNFSAAKGVGAGVYELRMDFGPGYRVYFGKDGERLVILLGGGSKKRQQTDIEIAKTLWLNYKGAKRKQSKDGKHQRL